jgi:hypothetical protein
LEDKEIFTITNNCKQFICNNISIAIDFKVIVSRFNAIVSDFNAIVSDFNAIVSDFNAIVSDFNAIVSDFNGVVFDNISPVESSKLLYNIKNDLYGYKIRIEFRVFHVAKQFENDVRHFNKIIT